MTSNADRLAAATKELAEALGERGWMCAAAESCTGGGIAKALTERAGSSDWFERGFVTYSNQAKQEMLDVPADTIHHHGAVSEQTARAMADGALRHSRAQTAVAVTGVAGPGGGSPNKPVGTVAFAWSVREAVTTTRLVRFDGDRITVREASILAAIEGLLERLHQH